jgi:hypothetical protein
MGHQVKNREPRTENREKTEATQTLALETSVFMLILGTPLLDLCAFSRFSALGSRFSLP